MASSFNSPSSSTSPPAPSTSNNSIQIPPVPRPESFDPGPRDSGTLNRDDNDCPFCHIATVYPSYHPVSPPSSEATILHPEATSPQPATFVVLSTPLLIAFLDIMPLSFGHVLLCPRSHRSKLTDATPTEAAELGLYLRVLSAAVSRVTGVQDWNVVQNNGAAAAQVVPHMHFHVIPRPELRDKGRERFTSTMFGRGTREDLDEEEAAGLAERIRRGIAEVLREDLERDGKKAKL
ncbi:HIT-like domain-containing protein [Apodospora peruviana]|uniref:HIT-like domain-containing protein n=1 Tax=Apodospora peruviana TaxID=516989 RepID=A0AAE0M4W0_9PEZI|nr:HIT-like domain-containing protein [Apodospora peruviana]